MLTRLQNFFKKRMTIVVVSGLPRSGTSMMMNMLDSGGIPSLIDNVRTADSDNPRGYFELDRVKGLKSSDSTWLVAAQGKSIKVITALLRELPSEFSYKIIIMNRTMAEILASQKTMLTRRGEDPEKTDDKTMELLYRKHLASTRDWLSQQTNIKTLDVDYNQMIENPSLQIDRINRFFGGHLDKQRMLEVVDPKLYRQRKT